MKNKDNTPDLFLEHINPVFREYAKNGTLLESIIALAEHEHPNRVITYADLGFKLEYEGYSNVFRHLEDALLMFSSESRAGNPRALARGRNASNKNYPLFGFFLCIF